MPSPQLMGIVNVTPDSFSDGGRFLKPAAAIAQALKMEADGAVMIDLGAESTRPGSRPVKPSEQRKRLLPVLKGIRKRSKVQISIDTRSAEVAAACLDEGADIINDVSALRDDRAMPALLAGRTCRVVLMHMQGSPQTMQKRPRYKDVVAEIVAFLKERVDTCVEAGISRKRIIVDPGIGFGKTFDHNLEILRRLRAFRVLKCPLLVGVSRKRFLGEITGEPRADKRVTASVAAGLFAIGQGASILRVHDVAEHTKALQVWQNLRLN